ncbi:hypothetical protein DESPIG_02371 [Desulfovibrio piger ATCC 29098]|uniref:Uncharacterized protein n=1 Tax=Desulfovibrio piger ATCC 29098 TaxID=411464 RepID=B6WWA3_9BACT|nr:hypothetical protein DESPIG_02371 [Desulfovibrio piger ATCC 29098]
MPKAPFLFFMPETGGLSVPVPARGSPRRTLCAVLSFPVYPGKASSSRRHVRMSGGCRSGGRGRPQGCRFAARSVDLSPYSPLPVRPTAPDATPGPASRARPCGRHSVARCCRCP